MPNELEPGDRPALSDDGLAAKRKALQDLEWLEDVEAAAQHLDHLITLGQPSIPRPQHIIEEVRRRQASLRRSTGGHQVGRQRPKQRWPRWSDERPRAQVSIDETGLTKGNDPGAPYFAAAAVIVATEDQARVRDAITGWQVRHFGRPRYIHEMDVRKRTGSFHFDGDVQRQEAAYAELRQLLERLPYQVAAVVIDKERFEAKHPSGQVDGILPTRLYPLVISMLFERVVHCLNAMGDRRGALEAEGIGEKEDAYLQHAVADLKIRGTRFQSERWFRYQLTDFVSFHGKVENVPGLQLADWIVKPCADVVRAVRSAAARGDGSVGHPMWDAVRPHMYDGLQGREDTFGLKVYPGLTPDERRRLFPHASVDELPDWGPKKLRGSTDEPQSP